MKNFSVLIFLSLLFFLLGSETVEIDLYFDRNDFSFEHGQYTRINTDRKNFIFKAAPGHPDLPFLMVKIAVPPRAVFSNIYYSIESSKLFSDVTIFPCPEIVPTSETEVHTHPQPDSRIYGSRDNYPIETVEFTGSHVLRKYQFFTLLVSPFIYNPGEGTLDLVEYAGIELEFELSGPDLDDRWDDGTFHSYLSRSVINPEALPPQDMRSPADPDDVEYLVVTSDELADDFQSLAEWKTLTGHPAAVVTTSEIYAAYPGSSDQEKIKKCIEDHYLNKGTAWVLLGGDNSVVPVLGCYGSSGSYTDYNIPADLYYACFDGQFDWNADGDGLYGELEDDIDLAPEVIISRIPVRTAAQVQTSIEKTIDYEIDQQDTDFSTKILLYGDKLFQIWEGRSDADWRNERLWNDHVQPYWSGTKYRYYDTNTDFGGPGYDVTPQHTIDQINSGYNYIFAAAHGSTTSIASETGGGFSVSHVDLLTNTGKQGVMVTIACNTNKFDLGEPCLSEALIRADNGGFVAYLGSSRQGWGINYPTDQHGPSYCYADEFFSHLFSDGISLNNRFGIAATEAKLHFIDYCNGTGPYRWLMFSINSIGDPSLDLFCQDPAEVVITAPQTTALPGQGTILIETGIPEAGICLTNWEDIYVTGLTDGNGDFEYSYLTASGNDLEYSVSGHNLKTCTGSIGAAVNIAPPTGNGSSGNPVAYDIENDQGGWIGIDYILSVNDPYHSEALEPYLDYYLVEKGDGSGNWQYVASIEPQEPLDSNNNGTLLISVPASDEPFDYRMAAVYNPGGDPVQSSWADAGTAPAKDNIPAFLDLRIFLEGPYLNGIMNSELPSLGLLPLESPYDGEVLEEFPAIVEESIVDWIWIETRSSSEGETISGCNAFVLEDGRIVNLNGGTSLPFFYTSGIEFYLVVKHRNHVEIMSSQSWLLSDQEFEPAIIDLTLPGSVFGIGHKISSDNRVLMIAGDASNNGQVQNSDKNDIWNDQVNMGGYLEADFNLNGQVQNNDKNDFWINNVNLGSTVPDNDSDRIVTLNPEKSILNLIEFSFANATVSRDWFTFDIMIRGESWKSIGDLNFYLNYNPEAFGSSLSANGHVEITRGRILETELVPGIDIYSMPDLDDNDLNRLGIHIGYNFPRNPEYASLVRTSPVRLCHVRMKLADRDQNIEISFENSGYLPMTGEQYQADNTTLFRPVRTSDVLFWECDRSDPVSQSEEHLPAVYGLKDNYPNPFSPVNTGNGRSQGTRIEFILDKPSHCEVMIYNLKGQKIGTLYEGQVEGNKLISLFWDGKTDRGQLADSGLYLYRLRTDHICQTKKMVLAR